MNYKILERKHDANATCEWNFTECEQNGGKEKNHKKPIDFRVFTLTNL